MFDCSLEAIFSVLLHVSDHMLKCKASVIILQTSSSTQLSGIHFILGQTGLHVTPQPTACGPCPLLQVKLGSKGGKVDKALHRKLDETYYLHFIVVIFLSATLVVALIENRLEKKPVYFLSAKQDAYGSHVSFELSSFYPPLKGTAQPQPLRYQL